MRSLARNRLLAILASLMICSLLIVGCSDDDPTGPTGEAPPLPPQSSFVLTFDDFDQGSSVAPFGKPAETETKQYSVRAAFHVAFWDALLTLATIVPTASFVAAFGEDPVYDREDRS